jgi:hypothetical protein
MGSSVSTVVEQSTHVHKFEGSISTNGGGKNKQGGWAVNLGLTAV